MIDKLVIPLLIFLLFFSLFFFSEKKDSKTFQRAEISQPLAEMKIEEIEPKKEKNFKIEAKEKSEITFPQKRPPGNLKEIENRFREIKEKSEAINNQILKLKEKKQFSEKEKNKKFEEKENEKEIKNQPELCQKKFPILTTQNEIIINEIAWMGRKNSSDEWLELKNISGKEINLSSWQLIDKDDDLKIIFPDLKLKPQQHLLLERSSDETILEIPADLIYHGILNNENEALYLFDQNCQLKDEVFANPFWPAGDKNTKQTMERKTDLTWQTSSNPGGTPKAENSQGYIEIQNYFEKKTQPPTFSSYPKILITEIQISSQNSEKDDFIELYNPNDEEIDLTNWYLQRKTKGASDFSSYAPKSLFLKKKILAKDYFLIANSSSDFLNLAEIITNSPLTEDNAIYLKNPKGEIVDQVGWGEAKDYQGAPLPNPQIGKSLGRKWSTTSQSYIETENNYNDFEIQNPTPKSQNQNWLLLQNQLPIAQFVYTPTNPTVGQEIIFDASLSTDPDSTITNYIWDFGDGNSTTTNAPTVAYSYSTSGDFSIILLVVDNLGTSSLPATTTLNVNLPQPPIPSVVINEIAWMGTKASFSDEWLELFNNQENEIDLEGWTLEAEDGSPKINLLGKIPGKGFYLLERTSDETIKDISADLIYKGAFSNEGEVLILRDKERKVVDKISQWYGGENLAKKTMERIDSEKSGDDSKNWASNNGNQINGLDAKGNPIFGTPKSKNSQSI